MMQAHNTCLISYYCRRLLLLCVLVVLAQQRIRADGAGYKWLSSAPVLDDNWRRDPTTLVVTLPDDSSDSASGNAGQTAERASLRNSTANVNTTETQITITKIDIFSGEPLPEERVRVNPGTLRNFCKVNIQGAVAGDTNATTRWSIATTFITCDGPDKVKIRIHPALGRFVQDFQGVQVLKNNFDDSANALVTFVGPQEVAIYNSTVLFLREVDPNLAFIALENGVNATMTRTNFFDNSGGLAPIMIDNSAVLLGSVGFVRNYSPKVAGGIYVLNGAQVTASRCSWDNNGLPESLPYAGSMYVKDGSQFILYGGGMTNNFGSLAGAVLVGNQSSIIIEGVHMANNTGLPTGNFDVSGALWIRNSNATVNGTAMDGNKASTGSGAIRVSGQSKVVVTYSQINENMSDDDGGAVSVSNVAGGGDLFQGEVDGQLRRGTATLQLRYMGLKANWGGGVKCKQGGIVQVRDSTIGDNVDGWGEKYNLDSKDCTEFDQENLQLQNTGYNPSRKDINSIKTQGSLSEDLIASFNVPSPAAVAAVSPTPTGMTFDSNLQQSVDTFALSQQMDSVDPATAAFNQFNDINSMIQG